jgi:hypothetical protein
MTELTVYATLKRQSQIRRETASVTHPNPYAAWALVAQSLDKRLGIGRWIVLSARVRSLDSALTPNPRMLSNVDPGASWEAWDTYSDPRGWPTRLDRW